MAARLVSRLVILLLLLSFSPRPHALALGGWVSEPHEVNGQTVQEIRLGAFVGDGQLVIAVVTNGSNPGTTRLMVARIQMLAALQGALPVYLTLLQSSNAFSLGGGCRVGNTMLFPYIESFRLHTVRISGDMVTTTTPAIAGTDQYVATECSNVGDTTYFALLNHTRQRIELYAEDANGFRSENAVFQNTLSVFNGAVRPALTGGTGGRLGIVYQQTGGSIRQVSFDAVTKMVESNCELWLQVPAPTTFTFPREISILPGLRTRVGDEYRFGALGNFAGGSGNTLTHFTSGGGCSSWTQAFGTSIGASPYGWLGSTVIPDRHGKALYLGNAAAWGRLVTSDGAYEVLAPPPLRAGGPIDGIGAIDNDSRRLGALLAGISPGSATQLQLSYNGLPRGVSTRWRSGFEDAGPRVAADDAPPDE